MAGQVVKRLPEGDDWVYELKFDGYRSPAFNAPSATLLSRPIYAPTASQTSSA